MSVTELETAPQVDSAALEALKGCGFTVRPDGEQLRRLRGVLKQREVEDACDLGRNRLTQYENGLPMNLSHLAALSNYYDVPPASLVDEDSVHQLLAKAGAVFEMFGRAPEEPSTGQRRPVQRSLLLT